MDPKKLIYLFWLFIKKRNNQIVSMSKIYQSLSSINKIRPQQITSIYRMIAQDKFYKFKGHIQKIDQILQKKLIIKEQQDGAGLSYNIFRLNIVLKYSQSYENILSTILPIKQITRNQLLLLINLLQMVPQYRSQRFKTLIQNIYNLVQKQIDKTYSIDSIFFVSIIKSLSRSAYFIPISLQLKLSNLLGKISYYLSETHLFYISNFMIRKNYKFLEQVMARQKNQIHLRIISLFYLRIKYQQQQFQQLHLNLPGKQPETLDQVQIALGTIYSMFHYQPYVDFIPTRLTLSNNTSLSNIQYSSISPQSSSQMVLKFVNIKYWIPYINYLFSLIKKGYTRLPQKAIQKFLNLFKGLNIETTFNNPQHYQHKMILKLLIIILDISRNKKYVKNNELILINLKLSQILSINYIKNHDFDDYQFKESQMIYYYIRYQMILNRRRRKQQKQSQKQYQKEEEVNDQYKEKNQNISYQFLLQDLKIKTILQKLTKRLQKYININKDSSLQLFRYLQKNPYQKIQQKPILFYQNTNQQQKQIIFKLLQKNYPNLQIKLSSLCYCLYKNVIIYPNINLNYAILTNQNINNKKNNNNNNNNNYKLIIGIDYDPNLNINYQYLFTEQKGKQKEEKSQNVLLPLQYAWKQLFLKNINCKYYPINNRDIINQNNYGRLWE